MLSALSCSVYFNKTNVDLVRHVGYRGGGEASGDEVESVKRTIVDEAGRKEAGSRYLGHECRSLAPHPGCQMREEEVRMTLASSARFQPKLIRSNPCH